MLKKTNIFLYTIVKLLQGHFDILSNNAILLMYSPAPVIYFILYKIGTGFLLSPLFLYFSNYLIFINTKNY